MNSTSLKITFVNLFTLILMHNGFAQPKSLKGYPVALDLAGKSLINSQQNPNGAPFAPLQTLALSNDQWLNSIDDLVGRVVKVTVGDSANKSVEIMINIVKDGDSLRVRPADKGDEDYDLIKKDRAGSFSFMGISANIDDDQLYEYKSVPVVVCNVKDKQLDNSKVPASAKCQGAGNCDYFYISGASVRVSETTLYNKKGKKVNVADLASFGVAKPFDGSIYLGDEKKHYTKRYIIFCTLLRIP